LEKLKAELEKRYGEVEKQAEILSDERNKAAASLKRG
jgi:DNA repair ATPase RecN